MPQHRYAQAATIAAIACLLPAAANAAFARFPSTFVPASIPYTQGWAAACDLNGDGQADLVELCSSGGTYVLLTAFGNADGTFSGGTTYPAPGYNLAPGAIADMNGDGRPDIVIGTGTTIAVWLSNADGTLNPAVLSNEPADSYGIATGDVNGDGHADVVASTSDVTGAVALLGNGDGTFQPAIRSSVSNYYPYGIALVDFDGDGRLDVLLPDSNGSTVHVLLGQGNGSFVEAHSYVTGAGYPIGLATADLDGDGRPDIVTGGAPPNGIPPSGAAVLLSTNNYVSGSSFYMGGTSSVVKLADLDGDGKLDLLAVNLNSHAAGVRFGLGGGAFGPLILVEGPQYSVSPDDVDHNGRLDLVFGGGVVFQGPPRTFGEHNAFLCGAAAIAVAAGDVNGDGIPDVVVANRNPGTVNVLLGKPGLELGTATALSMGTQPYDVKLADMNGDGHLDIVTAHKTDYGAAVRLGVGDGTFVGPIQSIWAVNASGVSLGDLDGDGIPDLVLSLTPPLMGPTLLAAHGNGDGTFAPPTLSNAGPHRTHLVLGDLNEDGHLDAVTTGDNEMDLSLGTGAGTFADGTGLHAGGTNVVLADVNGDGHLDIVASGGTPYNAIVLLGHGNGMFDAPVTYAMGGEMSAVAVADVDGDGIPDLVTVGGSPGLLGTPLDVLSVRLGMGGGAFGAYQLFGTESQPQAVAAADFDADGMPDLVVAHFLSQNVSLLHNRTLLLAAPFAGAHHYSAEVQITPNPTLRGVSIRFALARAGRVRLLVHDVAGRVIATPLDRSLPAGSQAIAWDGRDASGRPVAPGIYFAELVTPAGHSAQRVVLVH